MTKKEDAWKAPRYSMTNSIAPSEAGTEGEIRKDIKHGKKVEAAWGLFSDYCNNSTIHGVKYLGQRKRPLSERVWWIIAFSISLYGCGRLILNVWNKWDQSPVIVSFAEKSTPVWQIPFPAVTICPETKSKQSVFNFTEAYHMAHGAPENMTEGDLGRLGAIAQVCDVHLFEGVEIGNDTMGKECLDYLRELSPTFEEVMFYCKFRNKPDTCKELFSEIITEEGLCYTFNILSSTELYKEDELQTDYKYVHQNKSSEHWTLENGYTKDAPIDPFPVRVLGAGARAGLFVLMTLNKTDLDYICRGPVQGFKILLHTPGEIPQVSKQYFRVPLNQEVVVSVKPNMITTSEGLRHYAPSRRQCFFNEERNLRYFEVYTQQNCELECLANYTVKMCECVKFSMPRSPEIPICGPMKIQCISNAEDDLLETEYKQGTINSSLNHRGETECNCLPACTSIVYDAEISQADFDWRNLFIAYKNPVDEFPGMQFARLSIFFKETQFITSKRSELYGLTDFLANCGGLLGLFMGVSILSLVEIFYYLTIRLFCNLKMRNERKRNVARRQSSVPGIIVEHPNEKSDKGD